MNMQGARALHCASQSLFCVAACIGGRLQRAPSDTIVIGSKNFPEQALLGEILAQHLRRARTCASSAAFISPAAYICQQALLAGRIDAYVEYTGTALTAILHDPYRERSRSRVSEGCKRNTSGDSTLTVLPSLGFNNTFAMVIRGEDARRLHVTHAYRSRAVRAQLARRFRLRIHGAPRRIIRA